VSDFPLPQLQLSSNGGFLTNGEVPTNGTAERDGLESDESLGGALLTPIPWLRRDNSMADTTVNSAAQDGELRSESSETIEGPNGAGKIETVSVTVNGVPSIGPAQSTSPGSQEAGDDKSQMTTEQSLRAEGAVTQGELLRQEQEAGVVPVAQAGSRRPMTITNAPTVGRDPLVPSIEEVDKPEDHPQARGPDFIGMEDMGPQDGGLGVNRPLNMEAAVGRRSVSPQPPEKESQEGDEQVSRQQDAEGDISLESAGRTGEKEAAEGPSSDQEMQDS